MVRVCSARRSGVLALALVAAACGGSDDGGAEPTTTVAASTSASTTSPATTTAPTTTELRVRSTSAALELPRKAVYGHVVFEVTKAEFSNATPGTYLDTTPKPATTELLYVTLKLGWEPDFPGVSEDFRVENFAIVTATGKSTPAQGVDFSSRILMQRTAIDDALAFAVAPADLRGAQLVFDDRTHEPLVLPLTGTVPADPYPIVQPISGSGQVSYTGGCGNARGTVEMLGAEWDVDGGVDADGKQLFTAGTKRTLATERFLRIKVRSIASAGTCGGSIVGKDSFRLNADGTPLGPLNSSLNTLLKNGEGVELVVGFAVKKAVKALELEVGISGDTTLKVPLTPPSLP